MTVYKANSLSQYLNTIEKFDLRNVAQWFYRGVGKESYELIPSLFRLNIKNTLLSWKKVEEYITYHFKRESRPFLDAEPKSELEWLAVAQHYGLPTRLLDWTTNALIALFFAVEKFEKRGNAVVWCLGLPSAHNCWPKSTRIDRKLGIEKDSLIYFPNHISPRIIAQSGCFTIHDLPKERNDFIPLEQQPLFALIDKIIIQSRYKKAILNELYEVGIHPGSVYPGLDGLSKKLIFEIATTHRRYSNEEQFLRLTRARGELAQKIKLN